MSSSAQPQSAGNGRHAFLIMAHHEPEVLQELLAALDHPRNDIYLHIDRKAPPTMDKTSYTCEHAHVQLIERMAINWGGPSQITCELKLLAAALADGEHAYYHLLTGETYPIKPIEEIHAYFDEHQGSEFVSYDHYDPSSPESVKNYDRAFNRVRYIHLLPEAGVKNTNNRMLLKYARKLFIAAQKLLSFDRSKRFGMELKKGFAYWSITQGAASYTHAHEALIRDFVRYSVAADEIFLHTLIAQSPFADQVYGGIERGSSPIFLSTWQLESQGKNRPGHFFAEEDLPLIREYPHVLFALKFNLELIRSFKSASQAATSVHEKDAQ